MSPRNSIATLVALTLFHAAPLTLFSQGAPATPEIESWLSELKDIQERLAPVERAALEEPGMQEEQEAIGSAVLAAMVQADSTVEVKLDRLREIMLAAHGSNGSDGEMDQLIAEIRELQPQVEEARAEALARPEIVAMLADFRKKVQTRMVSLDPASEPLISRFEELERLIRQNLPQRGARTPTRGR